MLPASFPGKRSLLAGASLLAVLLVGSPAAGQFGKNFKKKAPDAVPAPKSAQLTQDAWQNVPMKAVTAAEIDQLVHQELARNSIKPAPLTSDEQFIRRVSLDLTGKPPVPAAVAAFVVDADPAKRAKLIDQLLDSDAYGKHWAKYWRDVIAAKIINRQGLIAAPAFETWLAGELKKNTPWDQITRTLLTAEGQLRFDKPGENGTAFFMFAYSGAEGANDRAAETSRIFMGIQIQCAQCHDHPFDQWKQVQFHEMAGYFARLRERVIFEDMRVRGFELTSLPFGEHQMAQNNDPVKMATTHPRFLDGKAIARNLSDKARREALAAAVTDKNNYWFAGAYVNRMWGELMGQSFYQPVDDMGPLKDAVFPEVLTRLAAAYRATDYDMKGLFRTMMNTETYQRQIRLGHSTDEHLHFAAAYPRRLPADALWESLVNVLGPVASNRPFAPAMGGGAGAMFRGRFGLESEFKRTFEFDPSLKADEIEGTIPQALILMNNPAINQRIRASDATLLGRVLKQHASDDQAAIAALYVQTLSRQPTDAEVAKCKKYIAKVGNRAEAFEDLLWALINSTEFQTKR